MNESFGKIIIAKRKRRFVGLSVWFLFIGLISLIMLLSTGADNVLADDEKLVFFSYILIYFGLAIVLLVIDFGKPRNVFSINLLTKTIHTDKNDINLHISNVKKVVVIRGGRYSTSSFGKIIIVTATKQYTFKHVKDCGKIEMILNLMILQNKKEMGII
ncbi:MAG: hypothetical protein IKA84_05385 [Clostridia bacterium]|nr:hypothetical protein [Clostridia bacterium]